MYRNRSVAVVLPAYNEQILIGQTIATIPTFVDVVVLVDDASSDNTIAVALDAGDHRLQTICHPRNCGVGSAITSGYRRCLELGVDITVVMGADGQMDPAELTLLLDPIVDDDADYVKGNRLSHPDLLSQMPLSRLVGNVALTMMTRYASGYRALMDSQCGYAAITWEALTKLELDKLYPRYGFPNDLLAQLKLQQARVVDRMVRPIYGDERSGINWFTAIFTLSYVLTRAYGRRKLGEFRGRRPELAGANKPMFLSQPHALAATGTRS